MFIPVGFGQPWEHMNQITRQQAITAIARWILNIVFAFLAQGGYSIQRLASRTSLLASQHGPPGEGTTSPEGRQEAQPALAGSNPILMMWEVVYDFVLQMWECVRNLECSEVSQCPRPLHGLLLVLDSASPLGGHL